MKMLNIIKRVCLIFFFVFAAAFGFALAVPQLQAPVNDYAGMLGAEERHALNAYLTEVRTASGVQIAVLTVRSLKGADIESFSVNTAENWKLGEKGKDNGVLVVVAAAEKKIRIEVGYGLEGVLTDMHCGMIIRNVIAPYFKQGQYAAGINAAVRNIVQLAAGETAGAELPEPAEQPQDDEAEDGILPSVIALFIFFFFMITAMSRKGRMYRNSGLWRTAAAASLLSALNNKSSGTFGGSSGGFGGFSGGGGGFGGGGASGGW